MHILPNSIIRLIESFEQLPGIGPKSAQRLAFYLLHVPQDQLDSFAQHLSELKKNTVLCKICKNVAEEDPCKICTDPNRDSSMICVVEQPMDLISIERTGKYRGKYHVLHGAIDPLNNVGPDEIYLDDLFLRCKNTQVREVIIATNPNMEGEATAMYIVRKLKAPVSPAGRQNEKLKITRLAHGLPVGADVEYADEVTLARALEGRREY